MRHLLWAIAILCAGSPDVKVELKGANLCCATCGKTALKTLEDAGVKASIGQDRLVSIVAPDGEAARKALDAFAAAGFHGDTGNKELSIADDSGAKEGKVARLSLKGVHNCCPQCCKGIKEAVRRVEGVESDDAKPRTGAFTVTGNFDAAALVKSLNAAGFHVKVDARQD